MSYGPQSIDSVFASKDLDDILGRVLISKRIADILHEACRSKGVLFDIRRQAYIDCAKNGITICTQTPTMASKIRQIQPTLQQALFTHGCHLPIIAVRANKLPPMIIDQNPPALGAVRQGSQETSENLWKIAQSATDPDVRTALERLSKAVKP